LSNDEVSFSGRFGGSSMNVRVPVAAVLAIYARETGQGMIFSDDDAGPTGPEPSPPSDSPPKAPSAPSDVRRAKFKVVK
jgi:stringent starvation protein B